MRKCLLCVVCWALLALDPWADHANACDGKECNGGKAGKWWFSFDSIRGVGKNERKYKVYYFHRKRCRVVGIYGRDAAFFRQAALHTHRVFRDPFFRLLLLQKRDWQLMKGKTRGLVRILTQKRAKIIANTFRRDAEFPCQTDGLDDHTNAFAPLDAHILFLSKSYLRSLQANGLIGVRQLARTIVHESLHTFGYSHRRLIPGSVAYNNTVPVFVACMVMHWPPSDHDSRRYAQRAVSVARYCSFSDQKMTQDRGFYVSWMTTHPTLQADPSQSRW